MAMKIELHQEITIRDIINGFQDNGEEGVVGYSGKLNIRPKYQREFIYDEKEKIAVIDTVMKGFPLNVMYWAVNEDGTFEVMDGQQRTLSFCTFWAGSFSVNIGGYNKIFDNLTDTLKDGFLDYPLLIYFCEGTEEEKLAWFRVVNIAGKELKDQELRNASFTGPWLTTAKGIFSKSTGAAVNLSKDYIKTEIDRQGLLEIALKWISKDTGDGKQIEKYMSLHQHDNNANELWGYFRDVIEWVQSTFRYHKEMKNMPWGTIYDKYHLRVDNPQEISARVEELFLDQQIYNRRGIFEYVLGGEKDTRLLDVRVFDEHTKQIVYNAQTADAQARGVSNCPLCAVANNNNKTRIYRLDEMDADHVSAWSRGGATDIDNCEMLCSTHNKVKGNK